MKETTVLVGLISKNQNEEQVSEYLDELAFLAETAGAETLKRFTQRLEHPDSKTFIGSGKLEQIRVFMVENNVKLAIFDDELSGSQIRNIEKILDCRVLDRNNLILDIFANRARTAQAKAQVELAQYQYLLPRLTRMWTHLEKQRGGIGMRGPGESEIETDRRVIKDKLSKLKIKLKEFEKQSLIHNIDLIFELRMGNVNDMQKDIGFANFIECRLKRFDQIMWKFTNETYCI